VEVFVNHALHSVSCPT